jgi:hypothetical protein
MAEQDAPNNRLIIALVVGTISSLIAIVLIVAQYFGMTVREEVFKKELTVKPITRRELEQKEEHLLTSYKWVSQKEGKVRIPAKQAEDLVLKEWDGRPTGLAPSADLTLPPPAAPAPGGAAPPSAAPTPAPAPGPTTPPAATPPPAPAPGKPPGAAPPK